MNASREYYDKIRQLFKENPNASRYFEYILQHGRSFTKRMNNKKAQKIADKYGVEPKGYHYCYYNSQLLTISSHGKIKYYEGMGTRKSLIPIEHAWNVLGYIVIDLTWEDADDYFGIEIPFEFVQKNVFKTGRADQLIQQFVISKIKR